jgi:hypothetical protein
VNEERWTCIQSEEEEVLRLAFKGKLLLGAHPVPDDPYAVQDQ